MLTLSRFTHRAAHQLPRELRSNIRGMCVPHDGPFAGRCLVTKVRDSSFHVCDLSPDGLIYRSSLGRIGLAGNHQRVDGLEPFDIPYGPSIQQRGIFWFRGRLWVCVQHTYGEGTDLGGAVPSLYNIEFTDGLPIIRGPWRFSLPHECTGGNIVDVTDSGTHFYITGHDANTFQKGSHGLDLHIVPVPSDDDPACDCTYVSGGFPAEADWVTLPGRSLLFHPGVTAAWVDPADPVRRRHSVMMSEMATPWGVDDAGTVVPRERATAPGWNWIGGVGKIDYKVPYEVGPYYWYEPDGRTYAAPGPMRGGAQVLDMGWTVRGVPGPVGHLNPMPTMHWASVFVCLGGERYYLQPYTVLIDATRWYGKSGEHAWNERERVFTPMAARWHGVGVNPYAENVNGDVYPVLDVGEVTNKGFKEQFKRQSITLTRLRDVWSSTTTQLRPTEWELAETCWPGWVDVGTRYRYLNPCNPDGTIRRAPVNYDFAVTTALVHEGYLYLGVVDADGGNGIINVLEIS